MKILTLKTAANAAKEFAKQHGFLVAISQQALVCIVTYSVMKFINQKKGGKV
jgi:hypothetical protein